MLTEPLASPDVIGPSTCGRSDLSFAVWKAAFSLSGLFFFLLLDLISALFIVEDEERSGQGRALAARQLLKP